MSGASAAGSVEVAGQRERQHPTDQSAHHEGGDHGAQVHGHRADEASPVEIIFGHGTALAGPSAMSEQPETCR